MPRQVKTLEAAYDKAVEQLHAAKDELAKIVEDMGSKLDDASDKWAESDAGVAYASAMEAVESNLQELESCMDSFDAVDWAACQV